MGKRRCRTPSTTNLQEEEIVDALRIDGKASMPDALNYKPRGRRDRGRPRKRWQRVDAGRGQSTQSMEEDDNDENDQTVNAVYGNITHII